MGFNSMINRIPQKISGRSAQTTGNYQLTDNLYDFAIGGLPLLSGAGDQRPDVEQPVEQRKNQFDNFKDPGEYSLSQWWLRSQSEFNGGAGIVYQDPDTQNTYLLTKNTRYDTSLGIDPFTDYSVISLLNETNVSTVLPTTLDNGFGYPAYIQSFTGGGGFGSSDFIWIARGHTVYIALVTASDIAITGTFPLTTEATQDFGITGGIAYSGYGAQGSNTAFVYQDQLASGQDGVWSVTAAGVTTNIYAGDGTHLTKTIGFLKGQLLLASGGNIYQLNTTGARAALPTPVAVLPQGQYVTSMTAGPDAVYISANDGTQGYIYKTTYSTTTITQINGVIQIAVLPEGEQVNNIAFYVGTYLVLATEKGVRVANVTQAGIVYGPLIFTIPKTVGVTNGCRGIAFFGTLAYIGTYSTSPQHDGAWGTYAVDLGTINTDNVTNFSVNAYCRWNYSPNTTTPVFDLTVSQSGRLLFTTLNANSGTQGQLWVQHATNKITQGYLQTGRCRFNTVEPKLFKYFSVRSGPLQGNISVSVIDQSNSETSYITYTPNLAPDSNDVPISTPFGQQDWIKLKFYLNRNGSTLSQGAAMNGWQIKALPGVTRQRMIEKWFLCFNNIQDKAGNKIGNSDYALQTLNLIRTMCQRQDTVNFQDLVNGVSTLVIVDNYQFVEMGPPGPNKENYGGYLKLDLRTVADSVPPLAETIPTPVD
jgi:hypothetical protein